MSSISCVTCDNEKEEKVGVADTPADELDEGNLVGPEKTNNHCFLSR
jgi:hypothetical protein